MKLLDRISPVPQSFRLLEGNELLLGTPGKANYQIVSEVSDTLPLAAYALRRLTERMASLMDVCPACAAGSVTIILSIDKAPENVCNPDQGYRITAKDDTIRLIGFGEAGLNYAVTTLLQCLKMVKGRVALPAFEVLDWPDLKTRGHFMETRYGSNLMELEDWKHVVDHMETMKQNHLTVSVYGCWCVQYDGKVSEYLYVPIRNYPKLKTPVYGKYYSPKKNGWVNFEKLPPMFEKDYLGELIAYGKSKGIEVLPMFNSFGHNTLIPNQYPEISSVNEQGEPERNGFCTSNPKTYELMFDVYDEIIDRYLKPNGITSFDVGLDEVCDGIAQNAEDIYRIRSPWCKCPECRKKTHTQIYIDHAIRLLSHLRDKGMTSIYMYGDMLDKHGDWNTTDADSCDQLYAALKANNLLDVVCIDWWSYSDNREDFIFQTTRPDLGIRRTVKPWNGYYHWTVLTSPLDNIRIHGDIAHEEKVEGMRSYSAWDESFDRNHRAQADFAWNFVGAGTVDEEKERYVRFNFPTRLEEAREAFRLMDLATTRRSTKDGSNRYALLFKMAYYFYSYVNAKLPYPRKFPGEAVGIFKANRQYLDDVQQMALLYRRSAELFEAIAQDTDSNTFLAKRFAYEMRNCQVLSEDFLALIEMDRLAEEFRTCRCGCTLKRIEAMAKERKEARLALMSLMEQTKEEFLMASHMRNHSIFMQYFADLESYLAATPAEDVVLDFEDNTHFASPAFMNLR